MILAGDEFGNTQYGNNNPYCQDNKISWLDWNDLDKNRDLFNFFKKMIAFRKVHPVLMRQSNGTPPGYPAVSVHGTDAWHFDSSSENRVVGIMFAGKTKDNKDDFIYIGVNAHWESHAVWLPALPLNMIWQVEVNTALGDNAVYDEAVELDSSAQFIIGARSVMVCTAKER
jgi:glycogen operon protein